MVATQVPLPRVVLDRQSYQAGETVRFRFPSECDLPYGTSVRLFRLASNVPVFEGVLMAGSTEPPSAFRPLYTLPADLPTGRYELQVGDAEPVSFAVWRSELEIARFVADRRFYSPGDPITFELTIRNFSTVTQREVRLEIGESQYPWILPGRESLAEEHSPLLSETLQLERGASQELRLQAIVRCPHAGSVIPYTAVLHSSATSEVRAFRSTAPVFLRCPEKAAEAVYPPSYIHSGLSQVRVGGYREFYKDAGASPIFDQTRTSFRAGAMNEVLVFPNRETALRGPLTLELQDEDGRPVDSAPVEGAESARVPLRFGAPGIYRLAVRSREAGQLSAVPTLEVSANRLPRSLAIVCAHPDDEFLHPAAIRSAVENGIPVHILYLTCGDAGGSDRFFGPDYSPAEAIEFGHIRMEEARAAARHLGVPEHHLHFLGLPDGFLEAIRTEKRGPHPVFAPMLGVDHAPYLGLVEPNLPYQKKAVLRRLAALLAQIDPGAVYTSHPDERHEDHKAASWLTIEALQSLLSAGRISSVPALRTDQFYGAASGAAAPFSYRTHEFYSSGEAMARVQEAYWFYQSQGGNHALGHVLGYAELPRREYHLEIVNWAAAHAPAAAAQSAA